MVVAQLRACAESPNIVQERELGVRITASKKGPGGHTDYGFQFSAIAGQLAIAY